MKYMIGCSYTVNENGKTISGTGNLEFECDHIPQTEDEEKEAERKMLEQFGFDSICVKRWGKE